VAFLYQLVDEHWSHVGEFTSEIPDWSVGQAFVIADGRSFAIVGIVPNLDERRPYTATWTVERA
jgi:hypothetical protein